MISGLVFHRWLALLAAPLLLVAAVTALALNHQDLIYAPPAEKAVSTPFGAYMLCVWADPGDARKLVVGTANGVYRSQDSGKNWTLAAPYAQAVALAANGPHLYLAQRTGQLHHSADAGATWAPLKGPATNAALHGLAVQGNQLVVLAADGVHRQAKAGWTRVAAPAEPGAEAPGRAALRVIYDLHDGRFWGTWGVLVTDLAALAILALAASGFWTWARRLRRPRRRLTRPGAP